MRRTAVRTIVCASLIALASSVGAVLAQERHEDTKLTASDAANSDHFSHSVSLNGDTIVVGAYGDESMAAENSGSARVFVKLGGGPALCARRGFS